MPGRFPGGGFATLQSVGGTDTELRIRGADDATVARLQPLAKELRHADHLAVAADTGDFAWAIHRDPQALHIRRAAADGTLRAPLRYDFASEFPPGTFELGRAAMLRQGLSVADAYPWGLVIVAAGQEPPGTGVRAGDVLIADEGHREFFPGVESRPGLWRCRVDSNEPVQRLGTLPYGNSPCDVAVSPAGVFLLSRTNGRPFGPVTDADRDRRVWRWEPGTGLRSCLLDHPIYDPTAIAADPLSADLYVAQGGHIPSSTPYLQQIFRLRPVPGGGDRFQVEVFAERFGKLSPGALAFTADGRMVITDSGNHAIVVLRRRAENRGASGEAE